MHSEREESGPDYFASMTDMVVGVLFVFIIMVAYFAFQVSNEDSVPLSLYEAEQQKNKALMVEVERLELEIKVLEEEVERLRKLLKQKDPMVAYIENATITRNEIVTDVIKDLKKYGIDAKSHQKGVVTISGKGLFANSRSDLSSVFGAEQRVNLLSEVLVERIVCNVLGTKLNKDDYNTCNPYHVFIESVYIEGHTDNVPITNGRVLKDGSRNNLELSARRATNTYGSMVTHLPESLSMINPSGQQVLSVAAYGKQRPISGNGTRSGRQNNRRIDIRFVMHVPKDQVALESFSAMFTASK
jgi:chemotaxis protein MotB